MQPSLRVCLQLALCWLCISNIFIEAWYETMCGVMDIHLVRPLVWCVRGRHTGIEVGTGKEIGCRRNDNATIDVQRYKAGQVKKWNIMWENKNGRTLKEIPGKEVEVVWTYGAERSNSRKESDGRMLQGRTKRERPKRMWLNRKRGGNKEKGLSGDILNTESMTTSHGCCSSSCFPCVGVRLIYWSLRSTATFVICFYRSLLLAFSLHFSSSSAFIRSLFTQSSHLMVTPRNCAMTKQHKF